MSRGISWAYSSLIGLTMVVLLAIPPLCRVGEALITRVLWGVGGGSLF